MGSPAVRNNNQEDRPGSPGRNKRPREEEEDQDDVDARPPKSPTLAAPQQQSPVPSGSITSTSNIHCPPIVRGTLTSLVTGERFQIWNHEKENQELKIKIRTLEARISQLGTTATEEVPREVTKDTCSRGTKTDDHHQEEEDVYCHCRWRLFLYQALCI